MIARQLRRDPALALVLLAMVSAAALYAPTLGHGLINYDDGWLLHDNWIVQQPSWSSVHAIVFDGSRATRFTLGAEYLPVRDLSVMLDFAIWGDWYAGHHATNLALYLAAIALWFSAFVELGIERKLVGVAILLWAIHPSHAESVAWLAERKGLLGAAFAGAATLGYARFRAGKRTSWLVFATIAAVAAVWSKALAAFALAGLVGLELALPERRASWQRSLVGLGVIGLASVAAFVPVVVAASRASVVDSAVAAPHGFLATVLGVHGFYVELAAMIHPNAIAYPIASTGPSVAQIALGALALGAIMAVAVVPRRGRWAPPPELRAAAMLWLVTWFPVSRLVLAPSQVVVADRYALLPSLGFALALAAGIVRIPRSRARSALVVAICLGAVLRTLDAQATWSDSRTLWSRAVESDPDDPNAWTMYAEALSVDRPDLAALAVARGLARRPTPRLRLRQALLELARNDRGPAFEHMREAAEAGEPRAMANLALMLLDDRKLDDALGWARRAVDAEPYTAHAYRTLGKVALFASQLDDALAAFGRGYALEPGNLENRFNLALALLALHRDADARPHLEACLADPALGAKARALLDDQRR